MSKKENAVFNIDGTQYTLLHIDMVNGQYHIVAEPFIDIVPDIKYETEKLLTNIFRNKRSKIDVSNFIVNWFLTCKALLKQNVRLVSKIKKKPLAADIRRLQRDGESWHDIIATLTYSFSDKVLGRILIENYRKIYEDKDGGKPIYFQLKEKFLNEIEKEENDI